MNDKSHNFKKYFGQNFLKDVKWTIEFISTISPIKDELIIEIGPGNGAVTDFLINSGAQIKCIEIDSELIPVLTERYSAYSNFSIVNEDILKVDIANITNNKPYKLVGALPYNISKRIIKFFLESTHQPTSMHFIIQKEVAYKYTSKVPKATFLSNYVSLFCDAKFVMPIPKHVFFPEPKVDGAIISFANIKQNKEASLNILKFIKLGFSQPRKKLSRNLANYGYEKSTIEQKLHELNYSQDARASEIYLEDWQKLFDLLNNL
jgi:16S rRNA (adenine1518-N6/adenine1519-N6)-dimethyltransferase